MSIITAKCWKCDRCGHVWIAANIAKPPQQCSRCRQKNWNKVKKP